MAAVSVIGGQSGSTHKSEGTIYSGSAVVDNRLYALVGRTKLRQTQSLPGSKEPGKSISDHNSTSGRSVREAQKKSDIGSTHHPGGGGHTVTFRDHPGSKTTPRRKISLPGLPQSDRSSKSTPRYSSSFSHNKTIEALKDENLKLLQNYEILMAENKAMREKLSLAGLKPNAPEAYRRVYFDRKVLRDAERANENRIQQLQRDVNEMTNKYHEVAEENVSLKSTLGNLSVANGKAKDQQRTAEYYKLSRELQRKLDKTSKEKEQAIAERTDMEKQTKALKATVSHLQSKVDALEKELEYMIMIGYR